jgi:S-formylglutathione hydrolase FrmB
MGGYGAVKFALKYPHLFAAATSHSGAVMTPLHKLGSHPYDMIGFKPEFEFVFGKDWRGGPNDPAALAEKCPKDLRPALRIDCGVDDYLIVQNRDFHACLNALDFPHEYQEFPGEHNWAYWDVHVQEALAFHCRHFGI